MRELDRQEIAAVSLVLGALRDAAVMVDEESPWRASFIRTHRQLASLSRVRHLRPVEGRRTQETRVAS